MKRLMLLLPLAVTACGDQTEAKLNECKDEIRAELKGLVEKTRRDAAESIKELEPAESGNGKEREPNGTAKSRVGGAIKALPDMFAAMAVPLVEAQLATLEPTAAGLARCHEYLAKARQR